MKWNPPPVLPMLLLVLGAAIVSGCDDRSSPSNATGPRWVQTAPIKVPGERAAQLSGTVRARNETPLAFQVGGRIEQRRVDAGQGVTAGQALFEMDPRDFEQALRVARAEFDSASAELATARAETRRSRDLLDREFISDQAFERVQLTENSARERVDAARARLEQAENALNYTTLEAPRDGTLIEVSGEPGQVVAQGQAVALLALDGALEVEVFLPGAFGEPATGRIVRGAPDQPELQLREVAGAADAMTRTWTARYALVDPSPGLRLGSVVRIALDVPSAMGQVFQVPIGAINERGQGPQIWRIVEGRAQPLQVALLGLDAESALIAGDLAPDAEIIALGTHLLESGMPVRAIND